MNADRDQLESLIGRQVSETISDFGLKGEFEPRDIMACYVMAIGACMSVVFDDASASKVKEAAGEWAKRGFTEANSLTFR
jgi:hypothetical protein